MGHPRSSLPPALRAAVERDEANAAKSWSAATEAAWDFTIPVRTVSEANTREHWAKKARRAKAQRVAAKWEAWKVLCHGFEFPLAVTLTRVAPRQLDGDNLQRALKAVRDGIADALFIDDRDPRVTWRYAQERGKAREYAVRVRIERRIGCQTDSALAAREE